MTITGCYEKDANFITVYSGDVMYTIARNKTIRVVGILYGESEV